MIPKVTIVNWTSPPLGGRIDAGFVGDLCASSLGMAVVEKSFLGRKIHRSRLETNNRHSNRYAYRKKLPDMNDSIIGLVCSALLIVF
jgi:hypothetical protein